MAEILEGKRKQRQTRKTQKQAVKATAKINNSSNNFDYKWMLVIGIGD